MLAETICNMMFERQLAVNYKANIFCTVNLLYLYTASFNRYISY